MFSEEFKSELSAEVDRPLTSITASDIKSKTLEADFSLGPLGLKVVFNPSRDLGNRSCVRFSRDIESIVHVKKEV